MRAQTDTHSATPSTTIPSPLAKRHGKEIENKTVKTLLNIWSCAGYVFDYISVRVHTLHTCYFIDYVKEVCSFCCSWYGLQAFVADC